jgi:hypothetical protein
MNNLKKKKNHQQKPKPDIFWLYALLKDINMKGKY